MSDIFREIDEELRRDNLAKLWARYGNYVIGLAVVIVLATAAVVGWQKYEASRRHALSIRYAAALELAQKDETAKAADAFAALAREASGGQAVLARLQEAMLRAKSGNTAAAIAAYKSLSQDGSIDPAYRDLATLLAALHELGTVEPKTVIAELEPLTRNGNPWRPSALEVTALAQLRAGDRAAALQIYKTLADDLTAPQALRQRATEMAAALAG
ncbi:MAG TPA: tetratricopeptide repeat protein [Stellaceae bacterium]|nr:tetratricopeptide repeat protein [Stellaceae bacterium]